MSYGPDKYSDEHPHGARNRELRDKARQAVTLYRSQPIGNHVPAADAAQPDASTVTNSQVADAEAAGDTRTAARLKARMLVQLVSERDARHFQRANGMTGDGQQP